MSYPYPASQAWCRTPFSVWYQAAAVMPNRPSRPSQDDRNHCTDAKAEGPDAAASSHHTSSTKPAPQAAPVIRPAMDSALVSCSMS